MRPVESAVAHGSVDRREAPGEEGRGLFRRRAQVRRVEARPGGRPAACHLPGDRPGDDIAGREFAVGVRVEHEAPAVRRRSGSRLRRARPPRPGTARRPPRTVGWNWTNSRSVTAAPARSAAAMPSPVATDGFVVCAYSSPAPPVASTTASACSRSDGPSRGRAPDAARPRQQVDAGDAAGLEHEVDEERVLDHAHLARAQPRRPAPSRSPFRWRRRPSAGCAGRSARPRGPCTNAPSASRSNATPSAISSRMRAGPSSTRTRTASGSLEPGARGQRVADVIFRAVVVEHHAGDAALRVARCSRARARPSSRG